MNKNEFIFIIESFINAGYEFKFFHEYKKDSNSKIILRHDIDLCINKAWEIAKIEKDLNVKSTFYFLASSDSYNLFSQNNKKLVHLIADLGHEVSLHFDPTVYEDELEGFNRERDVFEKEFGEIKTVSFHRPSKDILNGVSWLPKDVINAYDPEFFKNMKYISDSNGEFKYGKPLDSEEFLDRKDIQLLLHPIWWMTDGKTRIDKLNNFLINNNANMSKHMSANIMAWRDYLIEQ